MNDIWKEIKRSFHHFAFPSYCFHCNEKTHPDLPYFCPSCLTLLELIDHKSRCRYCFGPKQYDLCSKCTHGTSVFNGVASTFDYVGPPATLIKKFKYGNQPYLAEGAAAYMVSQFADLGWPFPDAIIPVPISLTHWLERGYNQSALLAEEMSKILKIPVWEVLKRYNGDYSQAGLNRSQRKALEIKRFAVKNKFVLQDKTLLLIDDVYTTGTTLKNCGEVLAEKGPKRLYALTFCRAR